MKKTMKAEKKPKKWVVLKTKKEYSRCGIPEMVGIYDNPYNKPVRYFIDVFIHPDYRHTVYGYKES